MSGPSFRIGLFGIGLEVYWSQFPGLRERLEGYLCRVAENLSRPDVEIVNAGLVDDPMRAREVGSEFRRSEVELIFLYATTYALSSTVLPVVRRVKAPVVVLNFAPAAAIDYESFNRMTDRTAMTGEWLAHCGGCPLPEISNVFQRAGIPFHQITGMLDGDDACWAEAGEWIDAACVANAMTENRLGLMGHYYGGMLDIYCDFTLQSAVFGTHFEILEVDELSARRRDVTESEVEARVEEFFKDFDVQPECSGGALADAARTAVALDGMVADHHLGSLAYYYKGVGDAANADTIASIILGTSQLTARGIPVAGEYEIKNVQAMKILSLLGAGGSFTEFYGMDYKDDVVLMGHDGPGHTAIAEGKTKVRSLEIYHGKVGEGASVEMTVKHGPVTLLSVMERGGTIALLVAEGESVPGPVLEIGNTNSRYRFSCGAREFVNRWNAEGPAHHCAVGVGHVASKIRKLGHLLGIETIHVT